MFSFPINDFHVRADPQHSLAYLKISCAKNKRKVILVLVSSWATLQENGSILPGIRVSFMKWSCYDLCTWYNFAIYSSSHVTGDAHDLEPI